MPKKNSGGWNASTRSLQSDGREGSGATVGHTVDGSGAVEALDGDGGVEALAGDGDGVRWRLRPATAMVCGCGSGWPRCTVEDSAGEDSGALWKLRPPWTPAPGGSST
jgi:hypothetical protein